MRKRVEIELIELPVVTYPDEDMYVSEIPVINVASQGRTVEESLSNLKEAVELYFEGEDVKKIIEERFPIPNVITTTMIFDIRKKQVIKIPISRPE
jgi:predicted RNase H-like HicB family nuclease